MWCPKSCGGTCPLPIEGMLQSSERIDAIYLIFAQTTVFPDARNARPLSKPQTQCRMLFVSAKRRSIKRPPFSLKVRSCLLPHYPKSHPIPLRRPSQGTAAHNKPYSNPDLSWPHTLFTPAPRPRALTPVSPHLLATFATDPGCARRSHPGNNEVKHRALFCPHVWTSRAGYSAGGAWEDPGCGRAPASASGQCRRSCAEVSALGASAAEARIRNTHQSDERTAGWVWY